MHSGFWSFCVPGFSIAVFRRSGIPAFRVLVQANSFTLNFAIKCANDFKDDFKLTHFTFEVHPKFELPFRMNRNRS